jgi:hypothetical protein
VQPTENLLNFICEGFGGGLESIADDKVWGFAADDVADLIANCAVLRSLLAVFRPI